MTGNSFGIEWCYSRKVSIRCVKGLVIGSEMSMINKLDVDVGLFLGIDLEF